MTNRFALMARACAAAFALMAASPMSAQAAPMREGGDIPGPTGFYELCRRSPADCPAPRGASRAVIRMDAAAARAINDINLRLNHDIAPVADAQRYGVGDLWEDPRDGMGDCEDYVIAKRAALIAAGFPEGAMLIGVAIGTDSPYHAVLILRTTTGELVLDNLSDRVSPWEQSGLSFVARQSAADPRRWTRVEPSADPGPVTHVASTRVAFGRR